MDLLTVFITIAIIAIVWHVVSTLIICSRLVDRGVKIHWILIRLLSPVYASSYRQMVRAETGHDAPLFYHWVISVNVALIAVLVAIAMGA